MIHIAEILLPDEPGTLYNPPLPTSLPILSEENGG